VADPAVILGTTFFGTISLFVSFFDPKGVVQSRLARIWARTLLAACGIKVRVEGLEQIDPAGSYVFVANHLSYMDTPVAIAHIPVQFRFLAKRGLFQIPLLGNHLKSAGHIPVPREDPRAAVKTMQQAADVIRQKKISLLIFPEGGRSHDGVLRPFKEGAAYIAIKAGVPLVPLALIGTREILPYGSALVQSGHVTLRILPPISTQNLTLKDRAGITDQLHQQILNGLGQAAPVA
jgi:1-acyl-sn-glycerol-3-phosphate acyltransferase